MALTFRDTKGSKLSSAEGDANIRDLDGRVTELEENPPTPIEISNIYAEGTQCHVVLADATEFVFTLPQATFRPSVVTTISATSHTVVSGDLNGFKRCTNASGCIITFDDDTLPVDSEVSFYADTDGPVTFDSSTDIELRPPPGFLKQIKGNGFTAGFKKLASGLWVGIGTFAEDVTA